MHVLIRLGKFERGVYSFELSMEAGGWKNVLPNVCFFLAHDCHKI